MLFAGRCKLEVQDRAIDGDLNTGQDWMHLHPDYQPLGSLRQAMFLFGARETGPALLLTARDPVAEELPTPAHHHRTATFRAMVGDAPKQSKNGPDWLGSGDFLAMGSNVPYSERLGTEGHWSVVMEADRRGGASLFAHADLNEVMRAFQQKAEDVFGFSWPLWEQDAERPDGSVSATFGDVGSRSRLLGELSDPSWDQLADGSAVGVVLVGDPDSGPAVILSRNAPGAVEAPAGSFDKDTFRILYAGSCTIGGQVLERGQFRFTEAGRVDEPVTHGPEGSTQILILADRRARLSPRDGGSDQPSARQTEIDRLLLSAK